MTDVLANSGIPMSSDDIDNVLLTKTDIVRWQSEKIALEEKLATLCQKIEFASFFLRNAAATERLVPASQITPAAHVDKSGSNLPDQVVRILTERGTKMSPAELRANLTNQKAFREKIGENPKLLYTALHRLAAKGRILRDGNGYCAPTRSPQGDTGATQTPATINQEL